MMFYYWRQQQLRFSFLYNLDDDVLFRFFPQVRVVVLVVVLTLCFQATATMTTMMKMTTVKSRFHFLPPSAIALSTPHAPHPPR